MAEKKPMNEESKQANYVLGLRLIAISYLFSVTAIALPYGIMKYFKYS